MKEENNYLFKFEDFVKETLAEEEHRETILNYGKYYGSLEGVALEDTEFYKNYLSKFDVSGMRIVGPDGSEDDFDYELFTRLVVASLSSEYELRLDDRWKASPKGVPVVDICLFVKAEAGSTQRLSTALLPYHVYKLHSIYMREQMDLSVMLAEENGDEGEDSLNEDRLKQLKKYEERKKQLFEEAKWYSLLVSDE